MSQLPDNLPHLQNLIKRDPEGYHAEFLQQYRRYESNLQVFLLQPRENSKTLADLIMFVAQVSLCFPDVVKDFPKQLQDILKGHAPVLHPDVRMTICRAMTLLRKKQMMEPVSLYELFFGLFRCQDKALRQFLSKYIINDIKKVNQKHKSNSINKAMQNHMYVRLADNNSTVVTMSLSVMTELYQRKIWNDPKTVNVISTACFSKFPKAVAIALKFFLGSDRREVEDSDDEQEQPTARDLIVRYQTHKKSTRMKMKRKKDMKKLRRQEKLSGGNKKKKNQKPTVDFSAIEQLHNPDDFAEKLYQKLQKSTNTFEIRLLMMMVISRVVGMHKLFLFNLYPFLHRFLQPHQREVTKILLSLAQASHDLVPPEILRDSIMTIANNFVTERNSSDVMAVGLNTIREICSRCPLAMTEDLLRDLTQYQRKHGKAVTSAARSLVLLFRRTNPKFLHKKDRGRFTEATKELVIPAYGQVISKDFVPGSEILPEVPDAADVMDGWEECSDSGSDSDGSWVNVSSDEETNAILAAATAAAAKKKKTVSSKKKNEKEGEEETEKRVEVTKNMTDEEKLAKSQMMSQTRIFSPADFALINAHQENKQLTLASNRKSNLKRKLNELSGENTEGGEVLSIGNIEYVNMKKPRDKEARMAAALAEKEDRQAFKWRDKKFDPFASTTNKQKLKNKPFMMVRPKVAKKKARKSFREKQIELRNSLIKRAKKYKLG